MKAAIINANNEVLNVIVWDETCTAPPDTFAFVIEDEVRVEPGWTFDNDQLIPPGSLKLNEVD